jgi:hypothetical protein
MKEDLTYFRFNNFLQTFLRTFRTTCNMTTSINSEGRLPLLKRYLTVCGYCFIVSFAASAFGFDQGVTGGLLAMQRLV